MPDFYDLPPERMLPAPRYTAARRQLEEMPSHSRFRFIGRWRHSGVVVGLGIGLSVGGGVALASGVFSHTQPGAPSDTPLGAIVIAARTGTATIGLGPAPRNATDVSLTLTGLGVATFGFPDGSSLSCSPSDLRQSNRYGCQAIEVVPLHPGEHSVTITTSPTASWRLKAIYINRVITPFGTNTHGQTYGVMSGSEKPDLIAVVFDNGRRSGYVKSADLDCASGADVHSPSQAVAYTKAVEGHDVAVPVYKSDGTTKIGMFLVGDSKFAGVTVIPLSAVHCTGLSGAQESGVPQTSQSLAVIVVPREVGTSKAQAIAALTSAGLSYDISYVVSSQAPGSVIAQNPAPGSRVSTGSAVQLSISSGG